MTQEMLPGFEEVTGSEPAPATAVTLTAREINNAFEAKKNAIQVLATAQIESNQVSDDWQSAEEKRCTAAMIMARAQVDWASAEVERVTTLAHFFEVEAVFKSARLFEDK